MFGKVIRAPTNQIALKFFKLSRWAYTNTRHYSAIVTQTALRKGSSLRDSSKWKEDFLIKQLSVSWHLGSNADLGESTWKKSNVFSVPACHLFEHREGIILYLLSLSSFPSTCPLVVQFPGPSLLLISGQLVISDPETWTPRTESHP